MARGFLSGVIWGTILSVGALATLSVLDRNEAEQREALAEAIRDLPEDPGDVPADLEPEIADDTTPEPEPEADVAEVTPEPSETADPGVETSEPEGGSEGKAATVAEVDAASAQETEDPAQPQSEPASDTIAEVDTTAPDTPSGDAGATSDPARRPTAETEVSVETGTPEITQPVAGEDTPPENVAADPTPVPEASEEVAALATPVAPDASTPVAPSDTAAAPTSVAPAPSLSTPESEVGVTVSTEPAVPPVPPEPDASTPKPEDPPTSEAEDTGEASEAAPQRPQVRQLVPETQTPEASDETVETAAAARPAIGRPATSLLDRDTGSASRLPSVGEPAAQETAEASDNAVASDLSPLQRYAAPVEITDANRPKMAIVLIDDGTGPLGPDTLDNFPFPVTFALTPGQANVAARMSAYRAVGYEVATLADVPAGAQPTDVEQLLAAALAAVPESVALVEAPGGALQADRAVSEQASRIVAESGHGLVLLPNGLNTAEAIARRENVPAISALRDFDGDGQDARTKRRFLDGAAFRARQDGEVVMLGRLTADTVSALLLWSLQDRASNVSMVPVSAILQDRLE